MRAHLELEAEVLGGFLETAISLVDDIATVEGLRVGRVLDVGSGPGVASCLLAERFPSATVVAADGSPELLAAAAERADRMGLAGRVRTRVVELPDGLDELGDADVVWASMVLHHVGDEEATLRRIRGRLPAGGLLVLVEFGEPARFVPDGAALGLPDVWRRLDGARTAWMRDMRAGLPGAVASKDHPTMLRAAGFDVVTDEVVAVHLDAPLDGRSRRFAHEQVGRVRRHVETYVDAGDLSVLDALLDENSPSGIMQRPDAILHDSRHLIVARATGEDPPG
jgi:SAM-dependent methyltransferase